MKRWRLVRLGAALATSAMAISLALPARAQIGPATGAAGAPAAGQAETSDQPAAQPPPDTIQTSLGPYGDPGGLRGTLAAEGVTYSLTYIGEALGNLSGGMKRGAIYEGRLDAQLDLDLEKLAGWPGAALHANAYQIHGRGLSRYFLGNLFVASGIEALSSTRLYELWFEQKLFDDTLAIRAGQLAADTEFVVSQYATLFVNSTFGFPAILGADLPSGGPAYPLATPGVRLKYSPSQNLTAMFGLFNGDPAGPGRGDPQANNRGGVEFRARDPAFVIGEAAYSYGDIKGGALLPGAVKLGAWAHLGRFGDQRYGYPAGGSSALLADPGNSGLPRRLRGNSGGYAIIDQLLYRPAGQEDGGLGAFARVAGAPGDRNLVSFYADGGLTYKGLPGRPHDTAGVSIAYARVSNGARDYHSDLAAFNPGVFQPIRSSEVMVEATYQAEIVPGWTVQPDFQYIWRPGGGVINPRSPAGSLERSAAVLGARTTIRY